MMNPNQGIFDRVTKLNVQLAMLERAWMREVQKRFNASIYKIKTNLITGLYPGPFETTSKMVANDVLVAIAEIRDWFFGQLQRVAGDINSQVPYLLTGIRKKQESDRVLSVLEAEDEEEDVDNLLEEIGDTLQLLSLTELFLLLTEWRWKGFTLRQQWENFMARQFQQLYQSLMGAASLSQMDPGSYTISNSARQTMLMELQSKAIGSGSAFSTIGGINATIANQLADIATKIIQKNVSKNPKYFAGVRWHSVLEPNTCSVCAGLNGQWFPFVDGLSTAPDIPHVRCQCSLIPEIRGQESVDTTNFPQWFSKQSPVYQKSILGSQMYDLWKGGKVTFRNFQDFRNGVPAKSFNLNELGN